MGFGFEWQVDVMPGRSILNLVPGANIVGPPRRLHKQDEVTFSNGNILKPRLPLVGVPGMFLKHCFNLLDTLGTLPLKDLIGDGRRQHMAGDVPGWSGGEYGKREKYKRCDQ